jgi:hypothetical protein
MPSEHQALPEPKPWYQSRGIWGALATILVAVLSLLGYQADQDFLTEIGVGLGTLAAGTLALYGRWQATRPIRRKKKTTDAD